jgi:hypothetical protein
MDPDAVTTRIQARNERRKELSLGRRPIGRPAQDLSEECEPRSTEEVGSIEAGLGDVV